MGTEGSRSQRQGDRREQICEAALDLAADGGNRAVTHHAIDDRLGISRGSSSYYYRTRQALLEATITHLTHASRNAFHEALRNPPSESDPVDNAAELIADQLDLLLTARRRDALARYMLASDAAHDEHLRTALARCLFSLPGAHELMESLGAPDPTVAAYDLISLLEGLLFDRIHGIRSLPDTPAGATDLRPTIRRWLVALSAPVE